MIICKTIEELNQCLSSQAGKRKGFVPTMGALHQGHLSLLQRSKKETDISVVSIFVNPAQFTNSDDLKNYPKTPGIDIKILEKHFCEVLFIPSESVMYPVPDNRTFNFGGFDNILEGRFRPGHFQGVAKIVSKFFGLIKPDKAYFGLKDYQQYIIIKELAKDYFQNIDIIGCPTVREDNGLAMSSRNKLLASEDFNNAGVIYRNLCKASQLINSVQLDKIKALVSSEINAEKNFTVEYIEFVNNDNLNIISTITCEKSVTCCIAVYAGKVRLIDNIQIFL